jgi:redox-sensitive bicupin YhaK (pirin superfamily)
MITIRKAEERGRADHGWLKANFSFSFAGYYDPKHMGFSVLRVLNDDRIEAGQGFGPHAHRDMEIITYVLDGSLRHRDSTGENHVLRRNEVQTMSAGTGIIHSEYNASGVEESRSIQIWILPDKQDVEPSYQQIAFDPTERRGKFRLLAGPRPGEPNSTVIHQNARLYASELLQGETLQRSLDADRSAWIQVVCGEIYLNDNRLKDGDGAAVSGEKELTFRGGDPGGEFLFFDLPA